MSAPQTPRNKVAEPSVPSFMSEILVVYPSSDVSSSFPITELGFELILDRSSSFTESSCDSDTDEEEEMQQQVSSFMRQPNNRPSIKQNSNKHPMIATSPARTLPLTPLSTSSPALPQTPATDSSRRVRTQSPRKISSRSLCDEAEQDDNDEKGRHYRSGLQRLVCTKQPSQGSEWATTSKNETLPAGDVTLQQQQQQQRRPLLRKLICQKYKPNQVDAEESHQLQRITPQNSPVEHRMKPRDISFSFHNNHSDHVDPENESAQWNTGKNSIPTSHATERSLHDNAAMTPRIVQRLEGNQSNTSQPARHHASVVELQKEFESSVGLDDQLRPNRNEISEQRVSKTDSVIYRQQNKNSAPRAFHSDVQGHYNPEGLGSSVWKNEFPSSPQIGFLGGSAYQRRIARFQKDHGVRESSPQFLFGSGQADDESSFVEWVEQIENENVNNASSQISNQDFGLQYVPTGTGIYSQAPNAITIPPYSKVMNKSLNTTADMGYSFNSKGGHQDDNHTPETDLPSSDDEDHAPAQFRQRQASFGGESAKFSLGSIDSHQFGQSQFIDATPEAIIAAAMAGDFDDDDGWSGHISVKDEEFALAGVYSKPRVPF